MKQCERLKTIPVGFEPQPSNYRQPNDFFNTFSSSQTNVKTALIMIRFMPFNAWLRFTTFKRLRVL